MDFAVEDLSFRSAQAASDFTSLVQASMSPGPGVVWVEREQLARATAELGLAGAGLVERAEAARAGYWSHADWAVFGTISTNSAGSPRRLKVEAVDLAHAVSLGETDLVLSSTVSGPFKVSTSDVEAVARMLGPWLNKKADDWRSESSKPSVAYLGSSSASTWLAEAVHQNGARWLDFGRAGRATAEAELSLAGLVQADPQAWGKAADLYIWDEPTEPQSLEWMAPLRSERALESQPYAINVWPPGGRPRAIAKVIGLAPPAGDKEHIVRLLSDELKSVGKTSPPQEARADLAARFAANALARQGRQHVTSLAEWRDRDAWLQQVQMLETAVFLNPADQFARELWLHTRWAGTLSGEFRSSFNFERFRFEAWGDYLDQFRTNRLGTNVWTPYDARSSSVADEFLEAAGRALQYASRDSGKHEVGIPDDIGGPVLRTWQAHFCDGIRRRAGWLLSDPGLARHAELLVRALVDDLGALDSKRAAEHAALCDQMAARLGSDYTWSRWVQDYREPITSLYEMAGRGPAGRTLLESADQVVAKDRARREQEARTATATVQLPRADAVDEGRSDEWLSTGGASFSAPILESRSEPIRFPTGFQPTRVVSLAAVGGRVWAVVRGREAQKAMPADPALGRQMLTAPNVQSFSVWSVAEGDTSATPAPPPVPHVQSEFESSAPWLAALSGELWIGYGESLIRWQAASAKFEPVDRGLLPANARSVASTDVGPWRYILGGSGICRAPVTGGASAAEKVLIYKFQRPPTVKKLSSLSPLPANLAANVGAAPAASNSFSARDSLALWEAILARTARQGAGGWTRTSETPRLILADGEFLWGVFGFGRIGLLHPGTTNWVGILQATAPASVRCMAVTEEALWLGLDGGDIPLIKIPKQHLLKIPHEQWVSEVVTEGELAAAASNRPLVAQSVLALFSGNAGRARELLNTIPESDLISEQRFLLALAYDEWGLNEATNRLRHETALLQDFPGSIYSRVLRYEQVRRRVAAQPTGPNSFATPATNDVITNSAPSAALEFATKLVAAYDLDGDGALNQEELAVAVRLEPRSL